MREMLFISSIVILVIVIAVALVFGTVIVLTKINISMGPYSCVDIDNNEVICEQTWRSHGTLYGITQDGKTVDLKSYKRVEGELWARQMKYMY